MTLQGYLHADEYGVSTSYLGGIGLSLAIFRESLGESARTFFGFFTTNAAVRLPRALVVAAIKESIRHPNTLPRLQTAIRQAERSWHHFRDIEMGWKLAHSDLLGSILIQTTDVWNAWEVEGANLQRAVNQSIAAQCFFTGLTDDCRHRAVVLMGLKLQDMEFRNKQAAWTTVFQNRESSTQHWWMTTQEPKLTVNANELFTKYTKAMTDLYSIETSSDKRIGALQTQAAQIAQTLVPEGGWLRDLLQSLLLGDLWKACMTHIQNREHRIQTLMVEAGFNDLQNTHNRILETTLRIVAEEKTVRAWFAEMSSYSWWLNEDIPSIVRRCITQENGDCIRIGATEINAIHQQMYERERIIEDGVRRIFIGMWNALPATAILFIVELLILCVSHYGRKGSPKMYAPSTDLSSIAHHLQQYQNQHQQGHQQGQNPWMYGIPIQLQTIPRSQLTDQTNTNTNIAT